MTESPDPDDLRLLELGFGEKESTDMGDFGETYSRFGESTDVNLFPKKVEDVGFSSRVLFGVEAVLADCGVTEVRFFCCEVELTWFEGEVR